MVIIYTSTHIVTGGLIAALISNPWGLVLAYLSHYFFDMFSEAAYKDICYTIISELIMLVLILVLSLATENYWILAGGFCANIIDIIDKYRHYAQNKEQMFRCHKKGYPVILDFVNYISNYIFYLIFLTILCCVLLFAA